MNLNDLEFYNKFLSHSHCRIIDRTKDNRILYGAEKYKLNKEFLKLFEIRDKINGRYNKTKVHYVFKQYDCIVLECFNNDFVDDEFKDFLSKELGLVIINSYFDDYGDYYYIECDYIKRQINE